MNNIESNNINKRTLGYSNNELFRNVKLTERVQGE